MDGIPALDRWNLVKEVFHSSQKKQTNNTKHQLRGNVSRDTTSNKHTQNQTKNLRIITQVSPFYRGLFFLRFRYLVGLGFFVLSSTNSDTGTGEMSLLGASSLSRTDISHTAGEEGEDEEDEEE